MSRSDPSDETAEKRSRSGAGASRCLIGDAVRRVDAVEISLDLARVLVHWLGQLAEIRTRQNGCASESLVTAQHALAEACVASGDDSRRCESESLDAPDLLAWGYDLVDPETAADMLGLKADTVRWHCRKGNLECRKVGRQLMVAVSGIENFKRRKAERSA